MNKSISWRHHIIPQFYLKGFVNESGMIYIYKIETDEILPNAKSPKSFFYERGRNTFINNDGDLDDFIESIIYNSHDNLYQKAFITLRQKPINQISNDIKTLSYLIGFINSLFYRIPGLDDYHNNKILKGDSSYFLPIFDANGNDKSRVFYNIKKNDPLYRYLCRITKGMKNMIPLPSESSKWSIFKLPMAWKDEFAFITGDSPIIIDNPELFGTCNETILFPLTNNTFIIRTNDSKLNEINTIELEPIKILKKL